MASTAKRKTTRAKLNRESALRDKRAAKEARKAARKEAGPEETSIGYNDEEYFGRLAEDPAQV